MRPSAFAYEAPQSLDQALVLLNDGTAGTTIIAGGQSLVPAMRLRLLRPARLVDVNRLTELDYIEEADGWIAVGALTRQRTIEYSDVACATAPLFAAAAAAAGYSAIRARATVGGAIALGDPAGDLPVAVVALNATMTVRSISGTRVIAAHELFTAPFQTSLRSDELLTEIRIPKHDAGWAFERAVGGPGSRAAVVSVAAVLRFESGRIVSASLAVGGAGSTPRRSPVAEATLIATTGDDAIRVAAAGAAADECRPPDNRRGSEPYRRQLVNALTRRALARAVKSAA